MLFAAQSILIIKMYNFVFGGTELAVYVDTIEWNTVKKENVKLNKGAEFDYSQNSQQANNHSI